MARETKVGLIVGLGVILFVGVFVSDYLSVPQQRDELGSVEDLSNFGGNTTNQPRMVVSREVDPLTNRSLDPVQVAAAALEAAERRDGLPVVSRQFESVVTEPPFRQMTPVLGEDLTPVALQPYEPPTRVIGTPAIDDVDLALGHQISPERLGPGSESVDTVVRIELPEPPQLITPQPKVLLHTVASGETLSSIARKHYDGDGNMWRSIRDANPGKVGPNGEVREGSELVIPKRVAQGGEAVTELSPLVTNETQKPARKRVRLITVKAGQTLSEIAAEHLGSSGKWQLIMDVNTDVLEKPEQLREGMKLRIPAEDEAQLVEEANAALTDPNTAPPTTRPTDKPAQTPAENPAATPTEKPADQPKPASGKTYTVKAGDSLSSIAGAVLGDKKRYKEIYQANRDQLASPDAIKVGMVLKLPAK